MNIETNRHTTRTGRRGTTLLAALGIVGCLTMLTLALVRIPISSSQLADRVERDDRARSAVDSVLALAIDHVWGPFDTLQANQAANLVDLRAHLVSLGIPPQVAGTDSSVDVLPSLQLPEGEEGSLLEGVAIEEVRVTRIDEPDRTRLVFRVGVATGLGARSDFGSTESREDFEASFVVSDIAWNGLDYALLANNINCVMCHATVDNAQRYYNPYPEQFGTFDRVKIGSIETFQLREDPISTIAGSLYLGGIGVEDDGDLLTDWDTISMKSCQFDASGKLVEDAWGELVVSDLQPADAANPATLENLYLDYNRDPAKQVDGELPDFFPRVIPDDGGVDASGDPVPGNAGNKVVDYSEYLAFAGSATGSIAGGFIGVSAPGNVISDSTALDAFMNTPSAATLGSATEGNVYLRGTEAQPIVLDGDIAVHGDVIIEGYVVGSGSVTASGNVYIPSDLLYLDGTCEFGDRLFGTAADGTQNALALAAGGNILCGDIFHPNFGVGDPIDGTPNTSYSFIMEELGIFNRMEWMKTQPELLGKTQTIAVDRTALQADIEYLYLETYEKEEAIYEDEEYKQNIIGYETVIKTRYTVADAVVMADETVTLYEEITPVHENPYYEGADYLPRYYGFTQGSEIPIYDLDGYLDPVAGLWQADERAGKYGEWDDDDISILDPKDLTEERLYAADGTPRAAISTLTGTGGWIADSILHTLITDRLGLRDATTAMEIDAILYTNNSIFGIFPKSTGVGVSGKLRLNGTIVAADVGLLAPVEFQLNYDGRGKDMIDLRAASKLSLLMEYVAPVAPTP